MKQLVLSSALALSLASGSVLAGQPNQQDMEMIFANKGEVVSFNVQGLSQQEMVEIEGQRMRMALSMPMRDLTRTFPNQWRVLNERLPYKWSSALFLASTSNTRFIRK